MTKTVLIVEDNEQNMRLFNDLLEVHGYATVQCRDGKNALDLTRQHRPDLILMDIQLPEISGMDIIRNIKADEELKATPIIAVTAFAMRGDEQKIKSSGCEGYLSKPISVARLMGAVQPYLN